MRAVTASFCLQAASAAALLFETILPTTQPTTTRDPWQCTTETLMQYFDIPKPTGALLTSILSYGDDLIKGCEPTETDAMGLPVCTFPEHSRWCGFTTAAPSSLLPSYSAYGSTASSWWSKHSSMAVELAEECPHRWFKAMTDTPAGAGWLNDTIAFASCYAQAHQGSSPYTSMTVVTQSAMAVVSKTTATDPQAAATTQGVNSVAPRGESVEMWVLAGIGLAAAAVNSVL